MATTDFLHGVEVVEIDDGPRTVRTVRSAVIGIVGTAPDANEAEFPLNQPVLIAGSRLKAAKLDTVGERRGTLPNAVDLILDQIGAVIIVVRVAEATKATETLSNVIGGMTADGQFQGVHALIGARSILGQTPRILCAPGFTSDRPLGLSEIELSSQGSNYTQATVEVTGGGGSGAKLEAVIEDGKITAIVIKSPGVGYTAAPTIKIEGDGTGAAAKAKVAAAANPVVAELVGIAERLRAVIIADGPNTTDEAAIAYANDFGSKRVYVVDPAVKVARGDTINIEPASSAVAGLIAKIDYDRGFWWSPSNQTINGIVGIARPVDFALGDRSSRANLLNENNVATIINEDGYRLWGNRTLSSDQKFTFLSVVRTADMINDSILRSHLWAVDRNITRTYADDVSQSVKAYISELKALGAVWGGDCFPDEDLNTPSTISDGRVYFNVDFSPPFPAEHVIFRSRITNDYIEDLF